MRSAGAPSPTSPSGPSAPGRRQRPLRRRKCTARSVDCCGSSPALRSPPRCASSTAGRAKLGKPPPLSAHPAPSAGPAAARGWKARSSPAPTLAHELQHLLNFAHRCVQRPCEGPEETWINEALSKVAEDLAGYGWNVAGGRAEGAAYLGHPGAELRGYDGRSLTRWEGDPIGNYQGAHSFLRLFTDRAGGPPPRGEGGGRAARGGARDFPFPGG